MIKVLIVEDSFVVRELLKEILSSDPELEIAGFAENGKVALEMLKSVRPDVITMDIIMPEMNGLETTRQIMETNPVPIVIISASCNIEEVEITFQAVEAGALAILEKPCPGDDKYEARAKEIIDTVKSISEVKLVRRWPKEILNGKIKQGDISAGFLELIAIGASTGGPPVIRDILEGLSGRLTVPVLIVQHITSGFINGFIEWLSHKTKLPIHIARNGYSLLPGHVYFAPDDFHMGFKEKGRIFLSRDNQENGLRPSVSYLFRSLSEVYGPSGAGVLLTGMGKDGAMELKLIKDRGGITIAQDRESSVVFGMPGEAIKLGGADFILSPEDIVNKLLSLM